MVRKRFDNLDEAQQEAILSAAADEFSEQGYSGSSVNRIIKSAGMSKGSLYYYFDNKADLFSTVVERALGRLMGESGWFDLEDVGADEFWEEIRARTHKTVAAAAEDQWWMRLGRAYHRFQLESTNEAAVQRLAGFGRTLWRGLIQRGQTLGVIRTNLPMGLLVDVMLGADNAADRWVLEHYDEFTPEELATMVDNMVDVLRDALDKKNEGWGS